MKISPPKDFTYNLLDCELEKGLHLRSFGFEDFTNRKSMDFFHRMNDHTFQLVVKGQGLYELDLSKHPIQQNDLFYLPPDIPLKYTHCEKDPYFYYWFAINGDNVENVLKTLPVSESKPIVHLKDPRPLIQIFKKLFKPPQTLYKLKASIFMLLHLLSGFNGTPMAVNTSKSIAYKILDFIKLNYPQIDFRIESLTKYFNISQTNLYRIFKSEIGISPKTFLTNYRMEKAYELLQSGERVILAAHSTGYNDIYHFSKQFKKHFNITPSKVKEVPLQAPKNK